ncbi:MAG: radical SAM protein [Candidatus Woesearchaeota archaeon]
MTPKTEQLLQQAEKVYQKNFTNSCWFERAIFLSWYCALGDCTFCYMSTQKNKIKNPSKARRTLSSILAEILITKKQGWKIEFLSSGYGAYTMEEIFQVVKLSSIVAKEKLWLNIGYLNEKQIKPLLPYIKGISVSIETVNWKLRKKVCPSKQIKPLLQTLELAQKYELKKAITIIVGLGETIKDINELFKFIKKYNINRVTFYSLNPHPGTPFTKSPETGYYLQWIAQTRLKFPTLEIVAGSWVSRLEEIPLVLRAGANAFTKFPALKELGGKNARKVEQEIKKSDRKLEGNLSQTKKANWKKEIDTLPLEKELKEQILLKLKQYLKRASTPK